MNATESRIVRALLAHLAAEGFLPELGGVDAVEAKIQETGDARIRFAAAYSDGPARHWVRFMEGNDVDIVSDHGDDRGPFTAAMAAFDSDAVAGIK